MQERRASLPAVTETLKSGPKDGADLFSNFDGRRVSAAVTQKLVYGSPCRPRHPYGKLSRGAASPRDAPRRDPEPFDYAESMYEIKRDGLQAFAIVAVLRGGRNMIGPDKHGKPTGSGDGGFLVTDQDVPRNVVFEFILSNYNIDGNLLKPEHKALLDQHIVPFLKENRVRAQLTGTASRTGASNYNRQLSLERVDRVRHYLMGKGLAGTQVPASEMKALGEDKSTSKLEEDPLERCVRIRIVMGVLPVLIPPRVVVPQVVPPGGPKPPAPVQVLPEVVIEVDTRVPWAIQELSGFNVGVSFGAGGFGVGAGVQAGTVEYHFLLVNLRTRQMAQSRFFGPAIGAGVGPGGLKPGLGPSASMSATQGSHTWDTFHSKAGTDFDNFSGAASWVEPAGLGLGSDISAKAILTFHGLGVTVRVSTGHTIGTPGSLASHGNFHLKPPVQLQL